MSIASEITRLQTAKADIKAAIEGKGVTVPSEATLDDYADYIDEISGGGGGGIDWDDFVAGTYPSGAVVLDTTTNITAEYKFSKLTGITSVSAPLVTTINAEAVFRGCTHLESVNFPLLTTVQKNYTFAECSRLQVAHFPLLTTFGTGFLYRAFSLAANPIAVFPKLTATGTDAFRESNSNLIIDLGPNCTTLGIRTLYNFDCKGILILRSSSIVTCAAANAIGAINTRADATIYIPKSLYDHLGDGSSLDYKAATNWSTADGYGVITWAAIEGSQYENAYADGTPISA